MIMKQIIDDFGTNDALGALVPLPLLSPLPPRLSHLFPRCSLGAYVPGYPSGTVGVLMPLGVGILEPWRIGACGKHVNNSIIR